MWKDWEFAVWKLVQSHHFAEHCEEPGEAGGSRLASEHSGNPRRREEGAQYNYNPHTHKSYDEHEKWKMLDLNLTTLWSNFQSKQPISEARWLHLLSLFNSSFLFILFSKQLADSQFCLSKLIPILFFLYLYVYFVHFDKGTRIIRSTKRPSFTKSNGAIKK